MSGGKGGGGQTVGFKYFLGAHVTWCHGPVDAITEFRVDDRSAWSGVQPHGPVCISAPGLFGGDGREGGVSGRMDFESGKPSQGINDYLAAQLGALASAYRGVAASVFRQFYWGNNPYLKQPSARLQRIHTRTANGIAQWYDETAEINRREISPLTYGDIESTQNIELDAVTNAGLDSSVGVTVIAPCASYVMLVYFRDGTYQAWSPYDSDAPYPGASWLSRLTVTDSNGDTFTTPSNLTGSAAESLALAQTGEPYVFTGADSYTLWISDDPVSDNRSGLSLRIEFRPFFGALEHADMNPAHILRECLTDPDWGMGYADADIDDTAFMAAADALYAEGFGLSLLWDRQGKLGDFMAEVLKHIDGYLYVSRQTGKWVLKLVRADYSVGSLLTLDPSNVVRVENFRRPALGELTNSVTVRHYDPLSGKTISTAPATDLALASLQGATIAQTVDYDGVTNPDLAARLAARDLRSLATPLVAATITTQRLAAVLNPGDAFVLDWPDYGVTGMVMRVIKITYGNGRNNQVRIEAAQDVFAMPSAGVTTTSGSAWASPVSDAADAAHQLVVEAPYLALVREHGQTTVDNELAATPEAGYLLASADSPTPDTLNARLWTDAGAGYAEAAPLDFCAYARLAADVGPADTAWTLDTIGADIDQVAPGSWAQIDGELVSVVALDAVAGTMTVGRGVLDTVPAAHTAGAAVMFWDGYAAADTTVYVDGETVGAKIITVTGIGTLALSDATSNSLTLASRAVRPYPPGNVKVGGVAYPDTIGGTAELALTWAHRDRLQQTGGTLIDTTETSIGPEDGTTYTLRIYGEDGDLIRTEAGLTGTGYTYATTDEQSDSGLDLGPLGDPYFANVSLLLHMDGADGSTTFTDSSSFARTVAPSGNAQIDTAQSKFGGASGLFDGSGDYLTAPDAAELDFGAGDFTIEGWYRTAALPSSTKRHTLICKDDIAATRGWLLFANDGVDGNKTAFYIRSGGTQYSCKTSGSALSANTWYHLTVTREGTNIKLWINGVLQATTAVGTASFNDTSHVLRVGALTQSGVAYTDSYLNGWIDDIRITKGVARYTANFTPPTAAFQDNGVSALRLNGRLRFELESVRDGYTSFQHHNHTVRRLGFGYNFGYAFGE